jgi:hypothetical protein
MRATMISALLAIASSACGSAITPESDSATHDGSPLGDAHEVAPPVDAVGPDVNTNDVTLHDVAPDAPPADVAPDVPPDVPLGPTVESPCGHWQGTSAWNCGADGHTLSRSVGGTSETVDCPNGCIGLPFGLDDQCRARTGTVSNTVNGHGMNGAEAGWVHYVAYCVVPRLQGARASRLDDASRVTWWALKEGVLDVSGPNPVGYSLCTTGSGDVRIGPTATCGTGSPWQVGVSGVQVTCCGLSALESMATTLFPGMTSDQVIAMAATEADYLPGTATGDAIVHSTGYLRASWLLRSSPIGFTFQAPAVTSQCITQSLGWCYGTGWSTSAQYAPTRAAALQSMADLRGILDVLSP